MCNAAASESGQLLSIQPCGWYKKLESDLASTRAALTVMQLRCGDLDVQNKRLSEHRDDLFEVVDNLVTDNEVLAKRNVALCLEIDALYEAP